MTNIIRLDKISKIFKNNVTALNSVSIDFEEGTFTAIMGPSGSGKSTLLNIIGLLDKKSEGSVYIKDIEVKDMPEDRKAYLRMKTVGFVFQGFYLNPNLSAIENVKVPMYINDDLRKENKNELALNLLKEFNMEEYADRYPNELSGGEQQRVCIARALANSPEIILADEPTGNLDEANERIIFEYLKKLSQNGKTVIVVSHNDIVKEYADRIIKMEKGKKSDTE